MSRERRSVSVAILDGLIYVVGGWANPGEMSDLVESYDPKTDQWTQRKGLDKGLASNKHPLVAFNGMLYAFLEDIRVREYDPVKNIWTKVNVK